MTVSIPRRRWCFTTPGASQFLTTGPTVGACDATFIITEEVRIASINYEGPTVMVRVATIAGQLYRLEGTSDLSNAHWTPAQADFLGTGGIMAVTEPASALLASRFYRLRVVR